MDNSYNLLTSYKKGRDIINSCKNKPHLKVAKKYLDNFLRVFNIHYSDDYIRSTVYQMYAELYLIYDKKMDELSSF